MDLNRLQPSEIVEGGRKLLANENFCVEKPIIKSFNISTGPKVFIINDTAQPVGAFKYRGAVSAVEKAFQSGVQKVVVASSGSFGMAVARAAQIFRIKCSVHMPATAPSYKRDKTFALGAKVFASYTSYEEAKKAACCAVNKKTNICYIDGISDAVMIGNASLALDVCESVKSRDNFIAVIVPLGIGSLALPTAYVLQEKNFNFLLTTVEPLTHCKYAAVRNKSLKPKGGITLADGAALYKLPLYTSNFIDDLVDRAAAVDENSIISAIRFLWYKIGIQAEGAGALATAEFFSNYYYYSKFDEVWLFVTGRNISDDTFTELI